MVTVSQNQIFDRWDTLPDNLREAMLSETNSDFIWKICEAEHIPEEKIYAIARIFGHVLLGFIHPEDMAGEIKELGIAPQSADYIANNVNRRIFEPLKNDILAVYEPISKLERLMSEPPRLVQEIKSATPKPSTPTPASIRPVSSGQADMPVGEFEKLRPAAGAPAESKPTGGTSEPPPVVLHEEAAIKSSPATSSFKLETPAPKLSDIKPGGFIKPRPAVIEFGRSIPPAAGKTSAPTAREVQPPPAASSEILGGEIYSAEQIPVAEIGSPRLSYGEAGKSLVDEPTNEGKPPRVVHYTEFRTPLAEKPLTNADLTRTDADRQPIPISKPTAPPNIPIAENSPTIPVGEFSKLAAKENAPEPPRVPPAPPAPPRPRIEPPEIRPPEPPRS